MRDTKVSRRTILATGLASGLASGATLLSACSAASALADDRASGVGAQFALQKHDERLARIVAPGTMATVVASGFVWTEGPTWDQKRNSLYFSDIPNNRVHSWDAQNGLGLWRAEAGSVPAPSGVQPGTNGLLYVPEEDALLVCDQSSRSIIQYDLAAGGDPVSIARGSDTLPFNSPNDLVRDREGGIYFTDPPYGLIGNEKSPLRVRSFDGIYYLAPGASQATVVDDAVRFPNGIGLSPDEMTLYVCVSDRDTPRIERYAKEGTGWIRDRAPFFDMAPLREGGIPGNTDGMAIAQDGTIFAAAPGGIAILTPEAELLGRLITGKATGNCCFGEDGLTLFVTSSDIIVRLPLLGRGLGF